jgi:ribosomal protein S18 acetylase RimI-like enzyme
LADADDVRRIALGLPQVTEIDSDGFDFRVAGRGFVWSYPERLPGKPRCIRTDIAVLYVGDEGEKQALLLGEPDVFFTAPEYRGWPLVLLRLPEVSPERLTELVTDAWRMRAPEVLAAQFDEARSTELSYRTARPDDLQAIADLHTDSWRRHYRGAYTEAFLDDEAAGVILDLWTQRFADPDPRARAIVAERDGIVVGLAYTVLGDHPTWGALLDNLHVSYDLKRNGVGSRLLSMSAQAVLDADPSSRLYLWVFEQNAGARAFYEARGGVCVERLPAGAPPSWLNGQPYGLRMAWRDPSRLLTG